MIIENVKKCTGCEACKNVCPVKAIEFIEDDVGFYYPHIDEQKCIHCDKCSDVCSIGKSINSDNYIKTYAGYSNNKKILSESTSGGLIYALSLLFVKNGGVVFGVEFSENYKSCYYKCVDAEEEICKLAGSKYIQTEKRGVFRKVKDCLDNKKSVLFIGCPCDVSGLHFYLKKDYDNLLTVGLICNGYTSYKFMQDFIISEEKKQKSKLTYLNCRSKKEGWYVANLEEHFDNNRVKIKPFFSSDIGHALLKVKRISCYYCSYKGCNGFEDIRVGDFWGAKKSDDFWNENGINAILVKTEKGENFLRKIDSDFTFFETNYSVAYANNGGLHNNTTKKILNTREKFIKVYKKRNLKKACLKTRSFFTRIKIVIPNKLSKKMKILYHFFVDKKVEK